MMARAVPQPPPSLPEMYRRMAAHYHEVLRDPVVGPYWHRFRVHLDWASNGADIGEEFTLVWHRRQKV